MAIRVAELFAGVGGFRVGLDGYHDDEHPEMDKEPAGDFETVWANQWEPDGRKTKQFAWRCYEKRFGEGSCVNEDITKVMDEVEAGERELPDVNMVVGGFPCFVAGTPVLTDTGYRPIEEIRKGDWVFTKEKRLRQVLRVGCTENASTVTMTGVGSTPIHCTPNHRFWSHRPDPHLTEWRAAEDLTTDGPWYVASPVMDFQEVMRDHHPKPYTEALLSGITELTATALGEYLLSGSFDSRDISKASTLIGVTQLEDLLAQIDIEDRNLGILVEVARLSEEVRAAVLAGMMTWMETHESYDDNDVFSFTAPSVTAAMNFAMFVKAVAWNGRMGFQCIMEPLTTGQVRVFAPGSPDNPYGIGMDREKGYLALPILSVTPDEGTTTVYNLEVDEDHSYVVGPYACHNCQTFSVARTLSASNGLTGEKGEKGVLWFEIYRFLQQKHPRYCLFENVDRLLKSPASCRGRDFATILCCLAVEGYTVEWRVVNSAEYGFPQRRKRTFIFAERLGDDTPKTDEARLALMNSGVMATALPHSAATMDAIMRIALHSDPYEENHEFEPGGNGKRSPFGNCGVMSDFQVMTCDVTEKYDGTRFTLGDVMTPEDEVPESFYVDGDALDRWKWLKGSKREKRVTKDGHEWWYSEGQMACPDLLENPSRTILTSEGGTSPSRMKHIVEIDGRWRRLVPEELERLQGFPTGWTDECGMTDNQRAFCMGNALVVGVVHMIGMAITKRDLERRTNGDDGQANDKNDGQATDGEE